MFRKTAIKENKAYRSDISLISSNGSSKLIFLEEINSDNISELIDSIISSEFAKDTQYVIVNKLNMIIELFTEETIASFSNFNKTSVEDEIMEKIMCSNQPYDGEKFVSVNGVLVKYYYDYANMDTQNIYISFDVFENIKKEIEINNNFEGYFEQKYGNTFLYGWWETYK